MYAIIATIMRRDPLNIFSLLNRRIRLHYAVLLYAKGIISIIFWKRQLCDFYDALILVRRFYRFSNFDNRNVRKAEG